MQSSASAVWIDGVPVAAESASVSVFDRGFLYGDSVFETLRTYDGRAFALDEHLARLEGSARAVDIELPLAKAELAAEVEKAVLAAGFAESYVRVMVTRGRADQLGLHPGLAKRPLRVLIVLPLAPLPAAKYERGIAAVTYRTQRVADGTAAAGAKLGNYLTAVLASRVMSAAGADEALIVDREGRVLEGATSNVFAVRAGELVTPPESLGILPGITRKVALRVAEELDLPVSLRALDVGELPSVDELFVSSSIRELVPVVSVDGRPVANGLPGPITQRLLSAFRQHVRRR